MKTLSGRLGRLLACVATLAALSVAAPTQAQDKKPINVLLPNENTTTLFPSIVARELGFFEDEGLDVTLLASDTTIPYVAFLMNNQADLVMLDAPQTFQAVKAQQPVAVVFEGMQYAPEVMIVREDSPIQSVADLRGKTIGLASDRDQITAQVALDTAGITIDEVETVVVGDSGPVLARAVRDSDGRRGGGGRQRPDGAGGERHTLARHHAAGGFGEPGQFLRDQQGQDRGAPPDGGRHFCAPGRRGRRPPRSIATPSRPWRATASRRNGKRRRAGRPCSTLR